MRSIEAIIIFFEVSKDCEEEKRFSSCPTSNHLPVNHKQSESDLEVKELNSQKDEMIIRQKVERQKDEKMKTQKNKWQKDKKSKIDQI